MIKQKGLQDYLNDDPSLKEKLTYEEFMSRQKQGFDDSGIEEAYEVYRKFMEGYE